MNQDSFIDKARQEALDYLFSQVRFLKGVGPAKATVLNRHNIKTVLDLLLYLPRKYLDYREVRKIKELEIGQTATAGGGGLLRGLIN